MKLLRVILTGGGVMGIAAGWGLVARGGSSAAIANGTAEALSWWGWRVLLISGFLTLGSILLGITRFVSKVKFEQWKVSKVIMRVLLAGVWKTLVLMPIFLIGVIFISGKVSDSIMENVLAEEAGPSDPTALIAVDFEAGKLTADEYINDLIYAMYDYESLPGEYQIRVTEPMLEFDLLEEAAAVSDSLSEETKKTVVETTLLGNVEFGTDASGNVASAPGILTENASALEHGYVTTVNKAKLSSNGNFVVFYTDTGDDKISDKNAEQILAWLEEIIVKYKNVFGFDFDYETITFTHMRVAGSLLMMQAVLEANGIDKNAIMTAMPVYIVNPFHSGSDSNVLASYVGYNITEIPLIDVTVPLSMAVDRVDDLFGDCEEDESCYKDHVDGYEQLSTYKTAPTAPFMMVGPATARSLSAELEVSLAHEMGHHFAVSYNYDRTGESGSGNNFISETVANYMANLVLANDKTEELMGHYTNYVEYGTCYEIDITIPSPIASNGCHGKGKIQGYPAFPFLENYEEIVPGGREKILAAIDSDTALAYLKEQAGETKYREVMKSLAQRTLLNNYAQNGLKTTKQPKGEEIPCQDICDKTYEMFRDSTRYFYFTQQEFAERVIKFSGEGLDFSLLGKKGSSWEVIDSKQDEHEFTIPKKREGYYLYAVAISNPQGEDAKYKLEISTAEAKELFDDEAEADLAAEFTPEELEELKDFFQLDGNCVTIKMDSMFDLVSQLLGGLGQVGDAIAELTGEDTSELHAEIAESQASVAEAKANLEYHDLTVCQKVFKEGTSFETAVDFTKRNMTNSMKLYEAEEDGGEVAVLANYNIWTGQAKAYLVAAKDGLSGLLSFSVK